MMDIMTVYMRTDLWSRNIEDIYDEIREGRVVFTYTRQILKGGEHDFVTHLFANKRLIMVGSAMAGENGKTAIFPKNLPKEKHELNMKALNLAKLVGQDTHLIVTDSFGELLECLRDREWEREEEKERGSIYKFFEENREALESQF
jgi:hypothetical protein